MTPLVIVGTGGQGRETLDVVRAVNQRAATWDVQGFLDDDPATHGTSVHGLPVLGPVGWLAGHPGTAATLAVGSTRTRRRLDRSVADAGTPLPVLVHPRASVGEAVALGPGGLVCAGACVTTDVTAGRGVLLNQAVTVAHDSVLGDHVTVAPGANVSGAVRIGDGCDIGTGAAIVQGVEIGEWTIVGAGAVVTRSLPANVTAVGVPARVIKEREPGWHLGDT